MIFNLKLITSFNSEVERRIIGEEGGRGIPGERGRHRTEGRESLRLCYEGPVLKHHCLILMLVDHLMFDKMIIAVTCFVSIDSTLSVFVFVI